jgi:hypothetical protein
MALIYKKITIGGSGGTDDKTVKVSTDDTQSGFLEDKIIAASARLGLSIINPGANEQVQLDVDETAIDHNNLLNYDVAEHRIIDDLSTTTTSLWSSDKIQTELNTKVDKVASTDNAVAKFDGIAGDVQDSGVIIDDSNNVTGVNNLTIDGDLTVNGTTTTVNTSVVEIEDANITLNNGGTQASADTQDAGLTIEMSDATDAIIGYDSSVASKFNIGEVGATHEVVSTNHIQTLTNKTINDLSNDVHADVTHIAVRNVSGITIPKGSPVYISGYNLGQDKAEINLSDADDPATMPSIGLAEDDILNNENGEVVAYGVLKDVDTSTFSVGDVLYVDTTAGQLVNARPTGSGELVQAVAKVIRSNAINGRLLVQGAGRVNAFPNDIDLVDANTTFKDDVDNTKQMKFELSGVTTATTRTLTVPDADTTLVGTDATQTVTNKSIDADNNTLSNLETDNLKAGVLQTDISGVVSDTNLASSQAVKNYVDSVAADFNTDFDARLATKTTDDVSEGITNQYYTAERAQDDVGTILVDSASIDLTYDDVTPQITATVLPAGVDHDALNNFVANEHIDHSSVSINTNADSGLSGGGDITTSRSLSVDINGTTEETAADNADTILIYDNSAGVLRKMSRANLLAGIPLQSNGDLNETSFSGASGASAASVTGFNFANGSVRSFEAQVSVVVDATADLYEEFEIRGIQRGADWQITVESRGDDTSVDFNIDNTGQITYSSPVYAGFVSMDVKFRAKVTTV